MVGIVLAAGRGKRMRSPLPKVLHLVDHKTILEHVTDKLRLIGITRLCLVLGRNVGPFSDFLQRNPDITVCIQDAPTGTGSAVAATAPCFTDIAPLPYAPPCLYRGKPHVAKAALICAGDVPAIDAETLRQFVEFCGKRKAPLAILGMQAPDPRGYGRLITDPDEERVERIVEDRDATPEQKEIRLCNTGVIYAEIPYLFSLLSEINNANHQGEYYLTDCVAISTQRGIKPYVFVTDHWEQFSGINTEEQLNSMRNYLRGNN